MESTDSYSDPHASAGIQIVTYDMKNKSTPTPAANASRCAAAPTCAWVIARPKASAASCLTKALTPWHGFCNAV